MKPISQFNLKDIVLINVVILVMFMVFASYICDDGLEGGECVKNYDNRFFPLLIFSNVLFSVFTIYKGGFEKAGMLLLNILIVIILFFVFATCHSISKAGLF
jgi:hypothetical protein